MALANRREYGTSFDARQAPVASPRRVASAHSTFSTPSLWPSRHQCSHLYYVLLKAYSAAGASVGVSSYQAPNSLASVPPFFFMPAISRTMQTAETWIFFVYACENISIPYSNPRILFKIFIWAKSKYQLLGTHEALRKISNYSS